MSILVKEDYVNPDIPLWAKVGSGGGGGSANVPVFLEGGSTGGLVVDYLTVIHTYSPPVSSQNGKYLVTGNFNIINDNGDPNDFTCKIYDLVTNTSEKCLIMTSAPILMSAGSVSLTFPYTVGAGAPNFYFEVMYTNYAEFNITGNLTYSVIFYPDP